MQTTIQSYKAVLEETGRGKQEDQDSAEFTLSVVVKDKAELQAQQVVLKHQKHELERKLADSNLRMSSLLSEQEQMRK